MTETNETINNEINEKEVVEGGEIKKIPFYKRKRTLHVIGMSVITLSFACSMIHMMLLGTDATYEELPTTTTAAVTTARLEDIESTMIETTVVTESMFMFTEETEATIETTAPWVTVPYETESTEPEETESEVEAVYIPVTTETPTKTEAIDISEDGEWVYLGRFTCTAYCSCSRCCGQYATNRPVDENGNEIVYTASGAIAQVGVTVAVDPYVIPMGTELKLNGNVYVAQDTGGGVDGNHIDIYFDDHQEALNWGVRYHDVYVRR